MPNLTSRLALIQPLVTDLVAELRLAITGNSTILDNAVTFSSGTLVARPAPALNGRIYQATDKGLYYIDTGSAWQTLPVLGGPYGPLVTVSALGNVTAVAGQTIVYNGGGGNTVTLPAPGATFNAVVGVFVGANVTGASPLTIATPSGSILGVGLSAASMVLGTPYSKVLLQSNGTNWQVVSGQQNTGWLSPTFGANWADAFGGYVVGARLDGDSIELCGEIRSGAPTNLNSLGVLLTLPAPVHPANQAYPTAAYLGPNGAAGGLALQVATNGVVTGLATFGNIGPYTINLDGVRFRAG